jgi:hypothetical protein
VGDIYEDGNRRDVCPTDLTARAAQFLTAWLRWGEVELPFLPFLAIAATSRKLNIFQKNIDRLELLY